MLQSVLIKGNLYMFKGDNSPGVFFAQAFKDIYVRVAFLLKKKYLSELYFASLPEKGVYSERKTKAPFFIRDWCAGKKKRKSEKMSSLLKIVEKSTKCLPAS